MENKTTGLTAGSSPAVIQPNDLAVVEKKSYGSNNGVKKLITSDFVPFDMADRDDTSGRYLKALGLLYFLEKGLPVCWMIADQTRFLPQEGQSQKPLWDFLMAGRMEFRDFNPVPPYYYPSKNRRKREVTEDVWTNTFIRMFRERILDVDLNQDKLHLVLDFSKTAESGDDFDLNGDVVSLISYEMTALQIVRRFDHHYAPYVRWVTFSELQYLYKSKPEHFGAGVSKVLQYFSQRPTSEQDVERAITGSLREIFYTKRSWDSGKYIIHTAGSFQSDAAYIRGGERYYELPEKQYTFRGSLSDARIQAEELVRQQDENNPIYEYFPLVYWITDEIGTVYY